MSGCDKWTRKGDVSEPGGGGVAASSRSRLAALVGTHMDKHSLCKRIKLAGLDLVLLLRRAIVLRVPWRVGGVVASSFLLTNSSFPTPPQNHRAHHGRGGDHDHGRRMQPAARASPKPQEFQLRVDVVECRVGSGTVSNTTVQQEEGQT